MIIWDGYQFEITVATTAVVPFFFFFREPLHQTGYLLGEDLGGALSGTQLKSRKRERSIPYDAAGEKGFDVAPFEERRGRRGGKWYNARSGWPEFSRPLKFRLIPLVGGPTRRATDDTTFSFAGKPNTFSAYLFLFAAAPPALSATSAKKKSKPD